MTAGPPGLPRPTAARTTAPDRTGRRVLALFRPYRRRVAVVAVAILVSSLLGIVLPFLTQAVFDRALFPRTADGSVGPPRLGLLLVLVGASIGVILLGAVLGVATTWLTTRLGNAVMRDLRDRLFAHLQRMELAFFTGTRTGEIQSRLGNDVAGVQSVVTDTASSILGNVVTVVSALVAMLVLSWRLTLVAVVLLPVFVALQVRVGRVRRRVAGATQRSVADMTAITQETLSVSGVLLAKVFDRQDAEVRRYAAENARQADLQVQQTMTGQSFFATVQAFFGLTPALVYLVAGLSIGGVFLAGGAATLTPGRSWRSRRCRPGCCSPWWRCCGSASTSRPRWRCSSASSSTSTCGRRSSTGPAPWTCGRRTSPGTSPSRTCASATPPGTAPAATAPSRGSSTGSPSTSPPGRSSPSWGPAARARRRRPTWCPASTTSTPAGSPSTATTSAT
ncbi:ABC transporter transmembrane domain-containing protein [Geodermatophilus sp. SYSU D00766]